MAYEFPGQGLNLSHSCNLPHCFNPLFLARDQICTSIAAGAAAVTFLTYCTTVGTLVCKLYFNKAALKRKKEGGVPVVAQWVRNPTLPL